MASFQLQFDRIEAVDGYNITLIDPKEDRMVGFKRIPQTEDDFDRQKISVIFPGLDPESEYQAILTTDVKDKNDPTADPNKSDETIIKIITNEVTFNLDG